MTAASSNPSNFWRYLLPQPPWLGLSLGQIPPDLALWDVTHQRTVRLANWRGKQPVVLDFVRLRSQDVYSPTDYPHIVAMNQAYAMFRNAGAEVLMIVSTSLRHTEGLAEDLQLTLPLLRDETGQSFCDYYTGQALGSPLPAQFVLDAQGCLRHCHLFSLLHPYASPQQLLTVIESL